MKATICKRLDISQYPEHDRNFRTHHFDSLVLLAGLTEDLTKKKAKDRQFMKNWSIATKWSVDLRYRPIGKNEENISTTFIKAVNSEEGGVLPWIKTYW